MPTDTARRLHNAFLDRLGQDIVSGRHPAGKVLLLEDVQRDYHVSRTLAREVLRVLQSLNMVQLRQRVGVTILPQGSWKMLDPLVVRWRSAGSQRQQVLQALAELGAAIFPDAAALAAVNATTEQRERLGQLVVRLGELRSAGPDQGPEAVQLMGELAATILRASGNIFFQAVANLVEEFGQPSVAPPLADSWLADRCRIAVAIAAGNADEARRASLHDSAELLVLMSGSDNTGGSINNIEGNGSPGDHTTFE